MFYNSLSQFAVLNNQKAKTIHNIFWFELREKAEKNLKKRFSFSENRKKRIKLLDATKKNIMWICEYYLAEKPKKKKNKVSSRKKKGSKNSEKLNEKEITNQRQNGKR